MFHHYYHVFADGPYWHEAVSLHAEVLSQIDTDYRLVIGVVGSDANRASAISAISAMIPHTLEVHEFEEGWEQKTLGVLQAEVRSGLISDPVLYTHTKAASNKTGDSGPWRACMERNVVGAWRQAVTLIESGEADTVGAHWLRSLEWPDRVEIPFYGGNYWWSSAEHLQRLPDIDNSHRWGAESWLGTVEPDRAADVVPGHLWPGAACTSHRDTRNSNVKITF